MAENFNTNLINVATAYIKQLKISVTSSSLKQQLNENAYFPSLYSISDVFERFKIPHEVFKIDQEKIEKLSPPFIAYLNNQTTGKDFVLVTSINQNEVQYIADNKKTKKVSKKIFLKNWENIVLFAEAAENSGEKDYQVKHKKEVIANNKRNVIVIASILILLSTLYFFLHSLPDNFLLSASFLLIIKMMGLAATILLLVYEIDKSNAFVKSICTAGKQTNCAAVLQSRASKIFARKDSSGGMSWGEAGFFYFASTFLFLLFPSVSSPNKIAVLSFANIFAAPYIVFSVYYQWKVLKQWCQLCLTVQAVLTAELTWSIINFWNRPYLPNSYNALLTTIYCLLIPFTVWYIIKPLILKAKNEPVYKEAYKRLLYNPDTFNNLLRQQAQAPDGYQNMGIEIGNPKAENTIIKVCNPYCGPCAKAHPVLDEIVHHNENVKLKLIFTATNDKDDRRGIAARHLLAINANNNSLQTKQALHDWYLSERKDYDVFAAKYPLNGELKKQEIELEKMKEWCKEAEISFTPTLFINGYRLPADYKLEELKYIL